MEPVRSKKELCEQEAVPLKPFPMFLFRRYWVEVAHFTQTERIAVPEMEEEMVRFLVRFLRRYFILWNVQ